MTTRRTQYADITEYVSDNIKSKDELTQQFDQLRSSYIEEKNELQSKYKKEFDELLYRIKSSS